VALHDSMSAPQPTPSPRGWHERAPQLTDGVVTLRTLRSADAPSLVAHLNDPRVAEYIAPAPSSPEAFRRFIRWTQAERRRRGFTCLGVVPPGGNQPAGVIQVWPIERDFSTAEWGFALGTALWGTGLFARAATLFLDAVFADLGVYRLEARAVDINMRGNRVFEQLGATREGVLRGGFRDGEVFRDHVMWSILAPEWRARRAEAHRAN
jgi:RimJ/RimL family protein N-acetyltransferase